MSDLTPARSTEQLPSKDARSVDRAHRYMKGYSPDAVLKGLNLKVEKGTFISNRGKSGVGKTTLLKIIGLLEPPDKGEVKLLGKTVNGLKNDQLSNLRLHHIGFIFQFYNLIPSLTVLENTELLMNLLTKINEEHNVTIVMTTTNLYGKLPTTADYFLKNGKLSEVT